MHRSSLFLVTGCLIGLSCTAPRHASPAPLEDLGAPVARREAVAVAAPDAESVPTTDPVCGSSAPARDLDEWRVALRDQWVRRLMEIVAEGPRRSRSGEGTEHLTVLVPQDGAFAALSDDQVAAQLWDRSAFNAAVWLHVMDGDLWVVEGAWTQPTRGGPVDIRVTGRSVCIAGTRVVADPAVDATRGVTLLTVDGLLAPSR